MSINGKSYRKGDQLPWYRIYPFFMIHMLMFGGSGFLMAYGANDCPIAFLYVHGGFAILIYLVFYLSIFGRDAVKSMLINAALGLFGIYCQIDWILSLFGKSVGDYAIYVHVIPFLYYVLYTFLLHNAVLDITRARNDDKKRKRIEFAYVAISAAVYVTVLCLT